MNESKFIYNLAHLPPVQKQHTDAAPLTAVASGGT